MKKSILLLAALMPSLAAAAPGAEDARIEAVLAAYRQAMGPAPAAAAWTVSYALDSQGLQGDAVLRYDAASGRFSEVWTLPPTRGGSGFDGHAAWQADASGIAFPQQGGDRPALAANQAYRLSNGWWKPGYGGARIQWRGIDADGAHLALTPVGGTQFEVWFDPATHLPSRLRETRGFGIHEERYEDYRREHGVMFAHRQRIDDRGEAQVLTLRQATPSAVRAEDYAMPASRPADSAIGNASGSTTVPMRLLNNHVFVDVRVNGQGPFPFLLDTGGHDILTPQTARALGLEVIGQATTGGGGEQTLASGYAHVDSLRVGEVGIERQTLSVLDFAPREIEGLQVGGMLGLSTLLRFVVRIDYGAGTVTFTDPARFDPATAGTAVPFVFYDHMPWLRGEVDGLPARFTIDTGSRSEVTLTTPFVNARQLRTRFPAGATMLSGWGAGGPVHAFRARVPSLVLGGQQTRDVVADLVDQRAGFFSEPNVDGNIGSGWLKRYAVTFDYARQVMYLAPLARPDADVGSVDRSGMWLNLGEGGYRVMAVVAGGPAAEAGLREGDVVTAIDGQGPPALDLSAARRQLRVLPAGRQVRVDYLRQGRAATATVALRDLLPVHAR